MKFVSEFCAKSDNTDTHLSSLITFIVRENLQVPSAYPNTQLCRNSPPKEMTDRRKRKQGQRPMTISSKVKRNTQQSKDHDAFILLKPVNIQNYRVDQEYKSC